MRAFTIYLLFASTCVAADRNVRFTTPMYFLPPAKAVVVTNAGELGPGAPKHSAISSVTTLKDEAKLPSDGPYDIWFVPKDGKPIKAIAGWKAKEGANEIRLNDHLGVISFRGEGQPRGSLIVTPHEDEGPETKKHIVIQTAGDTRADMAVLPGDYAIWVVPESGARARRVVDKIRVLAGKTATVE